MLLVLMIGSASSTILRDCGSDVAEHIVDSVVVGPGQADYSFGLIGGYSLVRSGPNRRSVDLRRQDEALPGDREAPSIPVVDWDVTRLGWNNRFVVCFQARNQDADGATGWWIIDTLDDSRFGPMNEDAYIEKLQALGISPAIPDYPVESYARDGVRDGA